MTMVCGQLYKKLYAVNENCFCFLGILWPIEAMPAILRWPSLACPCTLAIISYRNIMTKGWTLLNPQVLAGFGVVLAWILVFGIASVWIIKIKR